MIGQRLGAYEIIQEIGQGGMATVYRAYQPAVDRFVAVKVIQKGIGGDKNALERFQREARLIARLEHPHIVPLYDVDGANEPPYLVMRYMESGTLKEVMARGLLPPDEVSYLLRQVAAGLDYAHRQGVIHRDIKPSNIMIDRDGNAFVTDLGIARSIDRDHVDEKELTITGSVLGTPDYIAPEQAMGVATINAQVDQYSLGVIVFQMLTGKLPFAGPLPMAVMMKHISDPVPSAIAFNPALPPSIDPVFRRVMAKRPQDRYPTASEFINAVVEVFGGAVAGQAARLCSTRGHA